MGENKARQTVLYHHPCCYVFQATYLYKYVNFHNLLIVNTLLFHNCSMPQARAGRYWRGGVGREASGASPGPYRHQDHGEREPSRDPKVQHHWRSLKRYFAMT